MNFLMASVFLKKGMSFDSQKLKKGPFEVYLVKAGDS